MTAPSLPEFILAREGEWRAAAQAVLDAHEMNGWESYIADAGGYDGPASAFAELMTPARVLRQCDAIRAIVERYLSLCADAEVVEEPFHYHSTGLLHGVRILAAIWSDHADYREEWAA